MSGQYSVECRCGSRVPAELFEAGTRKRCGSCGETVAVPSTTVLKQQSGDPYPLLSPLEKIRQTVETGEPPFDGRCHGCSEANAEYAVPVVMNVLIERHVQDDGGFRPSLTGGLKIVVPQTEELWVATTFPLLLCLHCHVDFQSERFRARLWKAARAAVVIGLVAAFGYFVWNHAEAALSVLHVAWVVVLFLILATRNRDTQRYDRFIMQWLNGIPWAKDAIRNGGEFRLTIERSRPWPDGTADPPDAYADYLRRQKT